MGGDGHQLPGSPGNGVVQGGLWGSGGSPGSLIKFFLGGGGCLLQGSPPGHRPKERGSWGEGEGPQTVGDRLGAGGGGVAQTPFFWGVVSGHLGALCVHGGGPLGGGGVPGHLGPRV